MSLSSTEAECNALSSAIVEAIWLKKLINDFNLFCTGPIIMHVDNQATITICNAPESNRRVKHTDIKFNFIKQNIENSIINIKYVQTGEQQADILTKPLCKEKFIYFRGKLMMI